MAALQAISPQAADYLNRIDRQLWATPYFPGRRYSHTTSNIAEVMNSWIVQERRLSILDLLYALWNKIMDLRHRRLLEA